MLPLTQYSGILNRFFIQENRPLHYGSKYDSVILGTLISVNFVTIHTISYLVYRIIYHGHKSPYDAFHGPYLENNAIVIALLLTGWLFGYCIISWIIWVQFEQAEGLGDPDDRVPWLSEPEGNGRSMIEMKSKDSLISVIPETIVQLPDGDFVLGSTIIKKSN